MSEHQATSTATRLDPGAIQAIVNAQHGDPFAVLGPHEVEAGMWEIRAMLPHAGRVAAVGLEDDGELAELTRVHPAGFYSATLAATERPGYRLRIAGGAAEATIRDPYSFGSSLQEHEVEAAVHHGDSAFYHVLGAQEITHGGVRGLRFAVWAPNAASVSVVGSFNDWDGRRHPMRLRRSTGVWELFMPGLALGGAYKYEIKGHGGQLVPLKADPAAFAAEHPPATASLAVGLQTHHWRDAGWIAKRAEGDQRRKPMSIYECHLGSWARVPEEGNRYLTYRELSERLIPYVKNLGFTHIELLPITEFPFDGSWGYQPVSLFAPTSRFGTPADFAEFVEAVHAADIGLILDWVPAHFPNDAHGLGNFDSTHLYEHADPRQGFHQDWGTYIYNFGRSEVTGFLVANARYWLQHYHLDGLRVDAVASMLYLDYSREAGQWIPNRFGGNENLEAIDFLRRMNETAYQAAPGVVTIAEESTAWPGVSKPTYLGGLGFGFKWNMGWMHDTLRYMQTESIHRRHHHHEMTFGLLYAFSENFILPLSHDEVVHGKGSLINKMPGDEWQKFANLRAYLGFMWSHPGKKLLFMGCEFAQMREWNHDISLDWHLTDQPLHRGMQSLVRDLNAAYTGLPALHELDCEPAGFQWIIGDDLGNSVFAFLRRGATDDKLALVVCNFMPAPHDGYRIGVPRAGFYREIINTDAGLYGGGNIGNMGGLSTEDVESHGHPCALTLTLPPLSTLVFALE